MAQHKWQGILPLLAIAALCSTVIQTQSILLKSQQNDRIGSVWQILYKPISE